MLYILHIWYHTAYSVYVCVTHSVNWEWCVCVCVRVNWADTSNIQVFSRKQCKLLKIAAHWCHCSGTGGTLSLEFYIKMLLEPNYSYPRRIVHSTLDKCTAMAIDHIEVIRRSGDNTNDSSKQYNSVCCNAKTWTRIEYTYHISLNRLPFIAVETKLTHLKHF